MNYSHIAQMINVSAQLLIAALVWGYYRKSTFPPSLRYSTFGPRFWTGSVDACVMLPVGFAFSALLALALPTVIAAALFFSENMIWLVYTVYMHAKYGQTYGKMVCKIKVVDFKTEHAISFRQALLREGLPIMVSFGIVGYQMYALLTGAISRENLTQGKLESTGPFWLLVSLPLLWFAAEVLTMLTNEKRRALHDFIAGTVVVRTNAGEVTAGTTPDPAAIAP